ncbi:hypothetical protein Pcinc_038496 [Petrolisthes cinctipes]|uniref:Uncharacterized protein n=1 Tax=Petrolisthes cinctipes TaxID=88211 RepID=A0AAE1BQW4_PETCI|nr:hypothetical protein Pcinc_038496 [Petrolisthes cinctipes]
MVIVMNMNGTHGSGAGHPIRVHSFNVIKDSLPNNPPKFILPKPVRSIQECSGACTTFNNNECLAFSLNPIPEGQRCSLFHKTSTVKISEANSDEITEILKSLWEKLGPLQPQDLNFYRSTSTATSATNPTAATTTTTTTPTVIYRIVNNKGSSDPKPEQCEISNWAAVVFVLEKDKSSDNAFKMHYILCKTFPSIAFTIESNVATNPSVQCPENYAIVGIRAMKGNKPNWEDAESVEGICKQMEGWTINYDNCFELSDPEHPSKWQRDEFNIGKEHEWNRYFECPDKTLAVQIVTEKDGSKQKYKTVKCCPIQEKNNNPDSEEKD